MTKKTKLPTKEQQAALKKNHLHLVTWQVLEDREAHLIVKHRITGEVRVISK